MEDREGDGFLPGRHLSVPSCVTLSVSVLRTVGDDVSVTCQVQDKEVTRLSKRRQEDLKTLIHLCTLVRCVLSPEGGDNEFNPFNSVEPLSGWRRFCKSGGFSSRSVRGDDSLVNVCTRRPRVQSQ